MLFTFPRADLLSSDTPDALEAVLGHPIPAALGALWTQARVVHLGLDANDHQHGPVRKLYLEFALDAPPEPDLAFLAVKIGRAPVIHRYERQHDPAPLISALCPDPDLRAAVALLARQARLVLKVHESDSQRLSIDLNLADVTPTTALQSAVDLIVKITDPTAPVSRHWPSHLAIGRDGFGKPFATLYGWPDAPAP